MKLETLTYEKCIVFRYRKNEFFLYIFLSFLLFSLFLNFSLFSLHAYRLKLQEERDNLIKLLREVMQRQTLLESELRR